MVRTFAVQSPAFRGLAGLVAGLATICAVIVGAILAVFAAATVTVIALMTSAVLGLAAMATRARRTVRARRHRSENDIIEARHLGGHHWVATGWNERG